MLKLSSNLMTVGIETAIASLVLITTILSSSSSSSVSVSVRCMMEYEKGGAPGVYVSPECPQWVLSSTGTAYTSLQNRTLLNCQFAIFQGRRNHQEDSISCDLNFKVTLLSKNGLGEEEVGIAAVFDGHGGVEASEMASELLLDYFHLHVVFQSYKVMLTAQDHDATDNQSSLQLQILKKALSMTIADIDLRFSQEAVRNNFYSGSTAVVVLLYDGKILVANVGDSKALLLSRKIQAGLRTEGDSAVQLSVTALTDDHHPDRKDERARIEAAGGSVITWGVPRVNGLLAISRAIGDVYLKRYGVAAEPEYTGWQILTANDKHLVVTSDGIFESLTQQDVGDLISEWILHPQGSRDSKTSGLCLTSTSLAECIINTAYKKGSHDNLSAIVIPLRPTSLWVDI